MSSPVSSAEAWPVFAERRRPFSESSAARAGFAPAVSRGTFERLAEVEDHDAPLGRLAIFALRFDWAVLVEGQLQPRLILLLSAALLFFAATNLLDDERRQHLISFPGKPTHEDD
jgi:hypothetical protein